MYRIHVSERKYRLAFMAAKSSNIQPEWLRFLFHDRKLVNDTYIEFMEA